MIGDLFMALCRVPLLKKKLWRAWYNYLARAIRAPDWCFMNYGFADRESSYLQLEPGTSKMGTVFSYTGTWQELWI